MHRRAIVGAAALGSALLAACGAAVPPAASPPASRSAATSPAIASRAPGVLPHVAAWVHTGGGDSASVALVDLRSGATRRALGDAVASPDAALLDAVRQDGGVTVVEQVDAVTGAVAAALRIPGVLRLPTMGIAGIAAPLTPHGRSLVLTGGPVDAEGRRTTTEVAVVDRGLRAVVRDVRLAGQWEYDGISADGAHLYLLQDITDARGDYHYQVRVLDVATGALDPRPIVGKGEPEVQMSGTGVARAFSADSQWQLTVYAFAAEGTVVHALNLDNPGLAVCIKLPTPTGNSSAAAEQQLGWSLLRSAGGGSVDAVNTATGDVVTIATRDFPAVEGSARVPVFATPAAADRIPGVTAVEAKRLMSAGTVLSPDGRTMYALAPDGILAVDTATHAARPDRLDPGLAATGLGISPDGAWLVVADMHGALAGVPTNGAAEVRVAGTGLQANGVLMVVAVR